MPFSFPFLQFRVLAIFACAFPPVRIGWKKRNQHMSRSCWERARPMATPNPTAARIPMGRSIVNPRDTSAPANRGRTTYYKHTSPYGNLEPKKPSKYKSPLLKSFKFYPKLNPDGPCIGGGCDLYPVVEQHTSYTLFAFNREKQTKIVDKPSSVKEGLI